MHVGVGKDPESSGRGVSQGFGLGGIGEGTAQLGHKAGHRQRTAGPADPVLCVATELVHEPGGLFAVVVGRLHRGHDEPLPGPRARDVEQPAFLGEHRRARERREQPVEADAIGLQQRVSAPEVGPGAFLDVGHDDEAPLQTLGPMGGQQSNGFPADAPVGKGVGGDLLGTQGGQELAHAGVALLLLGPRGHLEECTDGVEVAVGHPRGLPPGLGRTAESAPPVGAVPEHPEHLLDGAAVGQRGPGLDEQLGEPAGATAGLSPEPFEDGRLKHRASDQVAGGANRSRARRALVRDRTSVASRPPSGEVSRASARSAPT